jgi:LysM repeat protein
MINPPKLISTLLALLLFSGAFCQTERERTSAYINRYSEFAMNEMLRTGVPASITLAQGIHETAGGQSDLASLANNHFGIKCKGEWTGETMSHDDDAKGECFRKYKSVAESYRDHSDFLKNRPHYAFLFKLDPTDYEGWAKGLKKAGYATNPVYSQKLIKIIVENNLQQFTLLAMQREQGIQDNVFAMGNDNKKEEYGIKNVVVKIEPSSTNDKPVAVKQHSTKTSLFKKALYPLNAIFNINEAKVIYKEKGTSLFALAANYNVSYKKLLDFNDLEETDILTDDQLIFLQKKLKKGAKDFHVVEADENLHDVAQKEGVQLASVLEYNHLERGMTPAIGEKIYLKSPAPVMPKLAALKPSSKQLSMK